MRSPVLLAAVLSLPALGLAACGGSEKSSSAASSPAASATTATRAAASPRSRVQASARALAAAKGFHLEGTATDAEGPGGLEGDIREGGSLRVVLRQGGSRVELRSVGGKVYLNADRGFWQKSGGGAAAKLFAGKWVTGPAEQLGGSELERFDPKALAYCLGAEVGKLEDGGTGEVSGTAVTKVEDLGGVPGTAPGVLSIAAEGPPFPLRIQQTGKKAPGGKRDARCEGSDKDTTVRQDVVLSRFGETTPIEVPPNAVDLESLSREGGATA